jgi:anthranilate synthase/indole-3-glycerol phosphate synthase/phosphoribosylanthranilate isomerase
MVTAATEESGVIMGVRHRKYTVEAVQYHPESVLSEAGDELLRNFLALRGGTWDINPQSLVLDTSLPPFPIEALNGKLQESPEAAAKIPSILEKICAQRLKDVDLAKSTPGTTPADIDAMLALHLAPPLIPLVPRLRAQVPSLMAEIKRASPSKGAIALTANAAQQALSYALAGAAVISVLTEPTWFKGSLLDMRLARAAIDALEHRPAILRKDFIIEEYQIAEARLHGADTVLLIVAVLPPVRLGALFAYARALGMEPLVEVNNAREMTQALELGATVIGVNNRNLHNFEVDMGTTTRLADMVGAREDVVLCALSGIASAEDVRGYVDQGVGAVLVGEALMRASDPRAFIRTLLDRSEEEIKSQRRTWVKICGIRTEDEARDAVEAGADMLGLLFVPSSRRAVTQENAQRIAAAVRAAHTAGPNTNVYQSSGAASLPWFARHVERVHAAPAGRPLLVGVFQNAPLDAILSAVAACQLDVVQLHGSEPVEWARHIPVPVIRAFHVGTKGSGLDGVTRPGYHAFVLLDAARQGDAGALSGGSGSTLDWDVARDVVDRGEFPKARDAEEGDGVAATPGMRYPMPIILAGGLNPENVVEAVGRVRPWCIDVSGGVETEDGAGKDAAKVREFVMRVRGAV